MDPGTCSEASLAAPLREVARHRVAIRRALESADALVRDAHRPRAQAQAGGARAAAEVEVVAVEGEGRVEAHAALAQHRAARREQHAVEELAFGGRGAEIEHLSEGPRALRHAPAQVGGVVAAARLLD